MINCSICSEDKIREDITHLSIYVNGSEGIMVCLECRILITEYVKTLRRIAAKVKLASRCNLMHDGGITRT